MSTRRWLARSGLIGLLALPSTVAFVYGCDSPTQYDDLCSWLGDDQNCYREFFIDVGTRCGSAEVRQGSFAARDKLGECYMNEGGIVLFEPPIDLAAPPPRNTEPLTFKFVNPDATECGYVTFTGEYDFVVSIAPDPISDADTDGERVVGGKFSMTGGLNTDTLAVECPTGGTYNFNRLQVTTCDGEDDGGAQSSDERDYDGVMPRAEIDFNAGGVDQAGVVRLRVYYPPIEGDLDGATSIPINYFECIIPPALPPCSNGVKDGAETDVDCGGGYCATRCLDGQFCSVASDCASQNCGVVMGLKQCIGP